MQKAAKLLEDAAAGRYDSRAASPEQLEVDVKRTTALRVKLERLMTMVLPPAQPNAELMELANS